MRFFVSIFTALLWSTLTLTAQSLPSPTEFFGHQVGEDYHLIDYTQAERYFKALAEQSDRVKMEEIGKTEEGRSQYMMIVSSASNLSQLEHYQNISQTLARAEVEESAASKLIDQGKAVVWIDGGLHATETVGSQQLIELYYQLLSRDDAETKRILDDVIILLCEINPDGQELVADWYMQESNPKDRNMSIPRPYQKYVGHDNNRDWYMNNMKETENVSRQLYVEWMPQIVYNHHQTGPAGTILAGPPYRDPFNYVYDPLVVTGIDGVASSMINRLNEEGKPGYTRLGGSGFNTWWNGGMRTTPYYHNMIGLLTEITGNPTPADDSENGGYSMNKIPFVPERLLADNNDPYPVTPQNWTFRRSIDYSVSLNYAVLDYASRMRDHLLRNIYRMGRNSIAKGNTDSWTIIPKMVDSVRAVFERDVEKGLAKKATSFRGASSLPLKYYQEVFKDPDLRDPRGYIIPSDQDDFSTAVKFINALIKSGIKVERSTSSFTVKGKTYPKDSYVIRTNQAFRAHVIDMFEPQDYRNDFQYPGGPPIAPYDSAGWTLALQMGIDFDRILEGFDGPFEALAYGAVQAPPAVSVENAKGGYLISASGNDSYALVNLLLKNKIKVERITSAYQGMPAGSFYVPSKAFSLIKEHTDKWSVDLQAVEGKPSKATAVKSKRIALFDRYGGSIPSGWVRWILEQYQYDFTVIYPQEIDKGNLHSKYDVLLFIDDGIPSYLNTGRNYFSSQPDERLVPEQYRSWLGAITKEHSIPQLREFIEKGGTVVTVGNNTQLAYYLDLPVENALVSNGKPLKQEDYYVPTSILEVELNASHPANWGMDDTSNMIFNNDPVFKISSQAKNIEVLSHFPENKLPLQSGWAWGQEYLKGGVTSFVASIGKGKFYAFSPEITFRAQAHGTFKLLFNTLYED